MAKLFSQYRFDMKDRKRLKALLFFSFFSILAFSQNIKSIDSVKTAIHTTSNLLQKAKYYNRLSSLYSNVNTDSALFYAKKGIALSTKNNFYVPLLDAHFLAGKLCYIKSDYVQSLDHFKEMKEISALIKNNDLYLKSINNIANVNIDLGKIEDAKAAYEMVINEAKKTNNLNALSLGLNNLAYVYRTTGKADKAIEILYEKIKNDEKRKDALGLGNVHQQLAVIYLQNARFKEASKAIEISNEYFKSVNDLINTSINQHLLGVVYSSQKDYKAAITETNKAVEIAKKLDDKRSLFAFYSEIGSYYYELGNYKAAEEEYKKSLDVYNQKNIPKLLPSFLVKYAKIQQELGKMTDAKANLEKALELSIAQKTLITQREALEGLAEYYIKVNDAENALKYKRKFLELRDSIMSEKNNKVLSELSTKYETEKKEAKIKLLNSENQLKEILLTKDKLQIQNNELQIDKQTLEIENNKNQIVRQHQDITNKEQKIKLLDTQNQLQKFEIEKKNGILFLTVSSIFLLLLFGYLLYTVYRDKQNIRLQKEIVFQQDVAAKAVIQAEENERQRMATTLHDGLGQLLIASKMNLQSLEEKLEVDEKSSAIYKRMLGMLDASIKEAREVSHQITPNLILKKGLGDALKKMIENLNTSGNLEINLNIENLKENIEPDIQLVLYRIFQESITNVIKHAQASKLFITLKQTEKTLLAEIKDNGVGFNKDEALKDKNGMGLENIITRIRFLKGKADIDSAKGKGTTLRFEVPID